MRLLQCRRTRADLSRDIWSIPGFQLSGVCSRWLPLASALVAAVLVCGVRPAAAGFVQQDNKLVGTGAVGNALQGRSVALSADGNTAIVGAYRDDINVGAAWVFTRSNGA